MYKSLFKVVIFFSHAKIAGLFYYSNMMDYNVVIFSDISFELCCWILIMSYLCVAIIYI